MSSKRQAKRVHIPRQVWVGAAGALAILIALAMLLAIPPSVPLQSLFGGPYVVLSRAQPSYYHPDGLLVRLTEDNASARVRVKVIPREVFLADRAGREWRAARAALADHLIPLSPIFFIEKRGDGQIAAEVSVAGVQATERLDLLAWDAPRHGWVFVPAALDATDQTLTFYPHQTPISVMVVETRPTAFVAGAVVSADTGDVGASYGLSFLSGVTVDAAGNLSGMPATSRASTALPLVANPSTGGFTAYQDANVSAVLIQRLMVLASPYSGLALDFAPSAGYTDFVAALAEQLHKQGKRLDVVLRGTSLAEYDPATLALVADRLWLAPGDHPADYLEGGVVQRALENLTDQVPRAQVGLLVSIRDVDVIGGLAFAISSAEAAAHLGNVEAVAGYLDPVRPQVAAGSILPLALNGSVEALGYDSALGMYYLTYRDENGALHHAYLATAQAVNLRLGWARRYALGAVAVEGLEAANFLADGLSAFLSEQPLGPPPPLQIVWQVRDEAGVLLTEEVGDLALKQYLWQVPDRAGRYTIRALLRGAGRESALGEITVEVIGR